LGKVDQKYVERFEMRCWRRMEISYIDRVKNEEVLHTVKQKRNFLYAMKRKMANWVDRMLRRNCLLKHVIEGKREGMIEVRMKRGRDLCSYWTTYQNVEDRRI
jgi:hypothetical protein